MRGSAERERGNYFCGFKMSEGIPIKDFSLYMGCFDYIISYLQNEISNEEIVRTLKAEA
jgi:hypothetical protein